MRQHLTQVLADLARRLQRRTDPESVMHMIVSSVVGTVPGAEDATVSLVQNRQRVLSAAFTSDRARRFDELQQKTRQGPCLDAMYQQQTVRVDDLGSLNLLAHGPDAFTDESERIALLAKTGQEANRKLFDVAETLTRTGMLGS